MLTSIKSLKIKIITLLFIIMLVLSIVLTVISIDNINSLVTSNINFISKSMIKKEKQELGNKIDLVSNIIDMYYKKTTPKYMEEVVKSSIISHQEQLFHQLNSIYNQYKETSSLEELQERLKDIVKYARYGKSGYFWINDMNCKMIMHPIKPQYDGKVFCNTPKVPFVKLGVDALQKMHKNRTFIKYKFYNPATKRYEFKVSLVRIFKPFGWIIGTGKYLSDITPVVKKQLLANIEALRYGKSGYFWINDMQCRMIMHPIKPQYDGKVFCNTPKVPFVELGVKALKVSKNGIAFIKYKFYNPATKKYENKLSVVKLFKPWHWMIGTGVYLDNIEKSMAQVKAMKDNEEQKLIYKILAITLLIIILSLFVSYYLTVKFITNPVRNLTSEKNHFKEIANIDYLTQILNRRAFFIEVEKYYDYSNFNDIKLGIMMLDIDFFKQVNDRYGHDAGDEVLKQLSSFIKNSLRDNDLFGRLGGEEFGICILNSDRNKLLRIATKIKNEVQNYAIFYNNVEIQCTISIGCYELNTKKEDYKEGFSKADKALYKAKKEGRNRAILF
jgi:methyl-accepting chemotaxis protein